MELREIIKQRDEAIKRYGEMQKSKLIELCEECGLYNVDVYDKKMKGRIRVEKGQFEIYQLLQVIYQLLQVMIYGR